MSSDTTAMVPIGPISQVAGVRAVLGVGEGGAIDCRVGSVSDASAGDVGRTVTRMFAAAQANGAGVSSLTFRFGAVQVLAFTVGASATLIVFMDAAASIQPVVDLVAPAQRLRSAA